ncbi:MAG: Lar family restriction alleviation protein [Endomicrobiaceae bacterium]|nr:Lar family restriction alleviation protein [Endomicrobiaceae bacterium]
MISIKNCPFCGKKPRIERSLLIENTWCYKHQCKDGKRFVTIEGYIYPTRKEAADDWNRRVDNGRPD